GAAQDHLPDSSPCSHPRAVPGGSGRRLRRGATDRLPPAGAGDRRGSATGRARPDRPAGSRAVADRAPSASVPAAPTAVSYDFVKILVDALNARGLHYAPVAVTTDFTVQGPGLFPDGFMNVQLTDRV